MLCLLGDGASVRGLHLRLFSHGAIAADEYGSSFVFFVRGQCVSGRM